MRKTEYSLSFFKDLEKTIKNPEELQNKNLNNRIEEFFSYIDLFQKELKQEDEKEKMFIDNICKKLTKNLYQILKLCCIFQKKIRKLL